MKKRTQDRILKTKFRTDIDRGKDKLRTSQKSKVSERY